MGWRGALATGTLLHVVSLAVAENPTHLIRFGYFSEAQPAVGVACARGWFDIPSLGVNVVCLPQSSGGYAVSRLGAWRFVRYMYYCQIW